MSSFCFTFYRSISLSIGLMPDTVDFKRLKICFRQRDFYSAGAIYSIHSALCRLLHAIRNIVLYICIIAWKFMNIIQCINVVVRKRKVGQLKKFIGAPQRPLHSIRKTNKFIKHWIYIYQSNKFCSSSSVVRSTLQSFVCAKKHREMVFVLHSLAFDRRGVYVKKLRFLPFWEMCAEKAENGNTVHLLCHKIIMYRELRGCLGIHAIRKRRT